MPKKERTVTTRKEIATWIYNCGVDISAIFIFSACSSIWSLVMLAVRRWAGFEIPEDVIQYFLKSAMCMVALGLAFVLLTRKFVRSTYPELDRDMSAEEVCARLKVTGIRALLVTAAWHLADRFKRKR